MRILIANDDGIQAEGLHALARELSKQFEVVIAAPSEQRSAASHCFTYTPPVRAEKVVLPDLPEIPAYAIYGTPVDCVRLGTSTLFEHVDMVVSGINHGSNTGTDVLHSGTIGAAMEAALSGIPAVAVSNYAGKPTDFSAAAQSARMAVNYLLKHPLPQGIFLSINSPDGPMDQTKGFYKGRICRLHYITKYEHIVSPYQQNYYFRHVTSFTTDPADADADDEMVQSGYIVLTPLKFDLTDYAAMEQLDLRAFEAERL